MKLKICLHTTAAVALTALLLVFSSMVGAQEEHAVVPKDSAAARWTFDDVEAGKLPRGWKAEGTNQRGPVARWVVKADADAPSKPNVLALTDAKEGWGGTFNLLWMDKMKFKDGVIEVKVKAGTGREDQGGGPIWRVQDKDTYYIARWNPLEDNFRLYYVKDGARKTLEDAKVKADPARWHTIRIEQSGDEIKCSFDGKELMKTRDATFPGAGGVGLWTKADALTSFDDLIVSRTP
ncbi:MAG: family 16 glycoside hydrolase [Nitrospirota bacterium]